LTSININRSRAITGKDLNKKALFERSKSMSPVKKRKEVSLIDYLFLFINKKVTNQILSGYFEVVVRSLYHHKTKEVGTKLLYTLNLFGR
jgi:hypothetical protein